MYDDIWMNGREGPADSTCKDTDVYRVGSGSWQPLSVNFVFG